MTEPEAIDALRDWTSRREDFVEVFDQDGVYLLNLLKVQDQPRLRAVHIGHLPSKRILQFQILLSQMGRRSLRHSARLDRWGCR